MNGFDIPMGGGDSEDETDLVGLFLLKENKSTFPYIGGGLYRDGALFIVKNYSITKKNFKKIFVNLSEHLG